jgi:hypothetical protein
MFDDGLKQEGESGAAILNTFRSEVAGQRASRLGNCHVGSVEALTSK